jgi:hypothetical protein
LYTPEVTVRVDNDAFPGTPIPPEEPTADNPPNGAVLDYYLPGSEQSVALRVYDSGHRLVSEIASAPEQPPGRTSLPIAERWFPKPQRLETSAGMHRYLWNLAWSPAGVAKDNEPDDGEGRNPRAPRVAPGRYTVELEVNGKKVSSQPLLLRKDPRSPATQAQFLQQFEKSLMIFRNSLENRRALGDIVSVKDQIDKAMASAAIADTPAITKEKKLRADLEAILEGHSGLDAATTELISALHAVESSDRPASSQALAVYTSARSASREKLKQWTALKAGSVAILNEELKAQGLPPLSAP